MNIISIGRPMSYETKKKMSLAKKGKPGLRLGKPHTLESKEKMRLAKLGKPQNPEHAANSAKARSEANKRRPPTQKQLEEQQRKQARIDRGGGISDETREKMRLAHIGKGHPHTDKSREKLSKAHTGMYKPWLWNPDVIEKRAAKLRGKPGNPVSQEARDKISKSAKEQPREHGKFTKKVA